MLAAVTIVNPWPTPGDIMATFQNSFAPYIIPAIGAGFVLWAAFAAFQYVTAVDPDAKLYDEAYAERFNDLADASIVGGAYEDAERDFYGIDDNPDFDYDDPAVVSGEGTGMVSSADAGGDPENDGVE